MYESFITYLRRISRVRRRRKTRCGCAPWAHSSLSLAAARPERKNFLEHKEYARRLAKERIEHFNKTYQFQFNRVSIRNQRTRWGSCSSKRNLNFNYKIVLLPPPLADYIIVHELCHLGEFNHSKKFWELVAKTIPNHREIRKQIRKNGRSFC